MPLVLLSECPPQPWRNGGGLTRELLAWTGGVKDARQPSSGADAPGANGDAGGAGSRDDSRGNAAGATSGEAARPLASPANADWLLRVSVADITQDGPFSPYPGVHRAFAVLEGAGVVLQWPEGGRMLGPEDEALHFAGEAAPGCRLVSGPTRDLNLMVRTNAGQAAMRRAVPGQQGPAPASPWRALYTHGGAVLQADGQTLTLAPGSLWWDDTGPAGPRWELQSGRGAWWLEVCGPGAMGLSPDGKPGGIQTSPHGKPGAIQFAPHGKPWAMQFSPHRKLDAAAGPGGPESVRAEPVEALQERPGSRTLRQAQGERWSTDRPSSTGSGRPVVGGSPFERLGPNGGQQIALRQAQGQQRLTDGPSTGAGRALQDRPLPFPLLQGGAGSTAT
jgi:uncharacterized protein